MKFPRATPRAALRSLKNIAQAVEAARPVCKVLPEQKLLLLERSLSTAQWEVLLFMKENTSHGSWSSPRSSRTFSVLQQLGLIEKTQPGILANMAPCYVNVTEYWGLSVKGELFLFRSKKAAKLATEWQP